MKTIGIITVQKAPNYGAELQCYALQHYLRSLGYDCEIIDLCRPVHKDFKKTKGYEPYINDNLSISQKIVCWARNIKNKYLPFITKNGRKIIAFESRNKGAMSLLTEKFHAFENRIVFSKKYKSIGDLYDNPPFYDVYITGSDQLWNPTQKYCIEPFFLTFVNNGGKKVSYATSIGQDSLSTEVIKDYQKWLSSYDSISLREQTAIDLLQPLCSKEIHKTIDPTLLVPKEEWNLMAISPKKEKYIFCFTLHYCPNLLEYARKLSISLGIKLIYWKHCYQEDAFDGDNCMGIIDISPEEWLGFIRNAYYVVTDSFHGSVFSLIFERNFATYIDSKNSRGCRIKDLFEMLDVKDRLIYDLNKIALLPSPNYEKVKELISEEKHKSENFLKEALK